MTDSDVRREVDGLLKDIEHAEQNRRIESESRQLLQQADDQSPPESVQLILRRAQPIGLELPGDAHSLWQYATRELMDSAASKAKAGFALLVLKESLAHGRFMQELGSREIPHSTAREAMNVAKLLLKIPESKQKLFVGLGVKKLNLLARLPAETIEEMAETELIDGQPVDDLKLKSTRELQETIRQLTDRHAKEARALKDQNDRLIQEKAALETENDKLKASQPTPDEAEQAALIRFDRAKKMVVEAMTIILGADLEQATQRVKLEAALIADFAEAHGRFASVLLRRIHPEILEGSGYYIRPEELEDAQDQLNQASTQLKGLRDEDLK